MANGISQYSIGYSRLSRALLDGFELGKDGVLAADTAQQHRHLFLAGLDSGQDDCPWGRLSLVAQLASEMVLTVHAYASNDAMFARGDSIYSVDSMLLDPNESLLTKSVLFEIAPETKRVNVSDMLLYEQVGRYLWLWVEVAGQGEATISNIKVTTPGDRFYQSFPEVFRNNGDFLHRYLSIFYSLYSDLQDVIDGFEQFVDIDSAPAKLLPTFAGWLGLELDGNFLDDDCLRRFVRLAPQLNACKGTRRAIELVVSLFVEETIFIVERNLLDSNQLAEGETLYGNSPYAFTLLVSRSSDELLRARLSFLIEQFKPIRSQAKIVFLGDHGGFDSYSYLDTNAKLLQLSAGALGDVVAQTGAVYLE